AALDILYENGSARAVLDILTNRIDGYLQARTKDSARIGAVIFSYKNDMLLKTEYADEIISQLEG
ncbi:MAG: cobalt-precorrin-6A synthase, partial [Ruminococcus sp.]|nr:cobalt-precorrin-6A synthase [Ruminococcus sp.]